MATILDLLMALNRDELPPVPDPAQPVPMAPAPVGNVPEYGGPSQVVEPPTAPLDTRIIQQMLALRGPAPQAPAPLSRGQRIANALAGFGAGFQGNGGEFLRQLQEPQRQYQRRLEQYNNLGTELGQQGLATAQRQQELKTRRAQEVSDRQFQEEFQRETRRLRLSDDREKMLLADAIRSRQQREDDERQAAEQRRREQAQQERDARLIARDYGKLTDNPKIALELGRYYAGLTDKLSPEAAKFESIQNRLAEAKALRLARIAAVGGAGKDSKLADEFENLKRQLYPARGRGDTTAEDSIMRRIEAVGSKLQAKGYEVGYGENPYQKPPQAQQGTATFSKAQVQDYARRTGQTEEQVEAKIRAKGGTVQ